MKALFFPGLLLACLVLLLVGCAETPTSLDPTDTAPRIALVTPIPTTSQARAGRIDVRVPRQTVGALRDGLPTTAQVAARLRIDPDGTAHGELRWTTREDGRVVIRALSGRGVFDEEGALVRVEVEFQEANGELVAATVTPGAETCTVIWDLINGSTGEVNTNDFPGRAGFAASGEIVVR